jgi:hypothetical protein
VRIGKKRFLLLLAAFFSPSLSYAQSSALEEAEKHYQSGEFEKARKLYEEQLAAPSAQEGLPASFYFNYGTILARAGATGEAYSALMRAAFAQPLDGDARHQLSLVERTLPTTARSVQPAIWLEHWPRVLRMIPWRAWLLVGLVFSALSLALLGAANKDRTASWVPGAAALFFFAITALAFWQARLPVYGVTKLAQIKSGPAESFSEITSLEPGSLVNEDGSRDGWRKIRFTKGGNEETVGWVQPTVLLEITR